MPSGVADLLGYEFHGDSKRLTEDIDFPLYMMNETGQ